MELGMEYWDRWYEQAKASGVAPHLADLGRQVMRDNAQHGLGDTALGEESDGPLLLAMCVASPLQTEKRLLDDLYYSLIDDVERSTVAMMGQRMHLEDDEVQVLLDSELPAYTAVWASHGR